MTVLTDYAGRSIRLTDERRAHFLSHPEIAHLEHLVETAISSPDCVVQSRNDGAVLLYYLTAVTVQFGKKYLCVVVKHLPADAFVITAYLTDKIKPGVVVWTKP